MCGGGSKGSRGQEKIKLKGRCIDGIVFHVTSSLSLVIVVIPMKSSVSWPVSFVAPQRRYRECPSDSGSERSVQLLAGWWS